MTAFIRDNKAAFKDCKHQAHAILQ